MVDNRVINHLTEWVSEWRSVNPEVPDGVLSGKNLYKFVSELQQEISSTVGDFGINSIGSDAELVLYSGVNWKDVEALCEASGGKYYMINQTNAHPLYLQPRRR